MIENMTQNDWRYDVTWFKAWHHMAMVEKLFKAWFKRPKQDIEFQVYAWL